MKNVMVVCRAGPRSNKWPWPIPSSCQRNSLRPLDCRPPLASTPGVPGGVPEFAIATAVAGWAFAGDACLPGKGIAWPGRVLLKKFILVAVLPARLHRHRLPACRRTRGRFCRTAIALRTIRAGYLHFAVNLRAFSNGNPQGCDI